VYPDAENPSPSPESSLGASQDKNASLPRISSRTKKRTPGERPRRARRPRTGAPSDQDAGKSGLAIDPTLYINREVSWLEFNMRVLEEANDIRHPLLERVKFLSIAGSNLDEFFMIRVAGIKEQIYAGVEEYSPDGLTPAQQFRAVHTRVISLLKGMSSCFWNDLHPKLAAHGIHLLKMADLAADERAWVSDYFVREIYPVLTPLAFDPGHPFPYISNLSLNLAVVVCTPSGEDRFARVKVPGVLPRLVPIPDEPGAVARFRFVWLEDLIADNLGLLFPGMAVKESYAFRVTRNADIEIQEDEAEDLIHSIQESIRQRRFGSVVRVGVEKSMPVRIKQILIDNLEVSADDVYELTPPLGLEHLMALLRIPRPELKDPVFYPASSTLDEDGDDIFSAIRRNDIVLHHPYDSFAPVVQFIRAAANDPSVLAIKQTLYRIGKESPLIPLLVKAAENGKQVAVLVELKARFDEENNIGWAHQLERAGIHVVYGLVGLKTHAKMALVVRKDQDGLRRYVHLGTGNYNPTTARVYTDLTYFTCRDEMTRDATEVFNFLTGYSKNAAYSKLIVAPVTLRERMMWLVDREIQCARSGGQGRIVMKMNALTDVKIIAQLYEASKAGVRIDLIVRGVCSLRPGVPGISDNIRIVSLVGRFLEHSRVYWFENGGKPEVYLSSADMMGRNLDRRVELMFPIEDKHLAGFIKEEVLDTILADNVRSRLLSPEGKYSCPPAVNDPLLLDAQQAILLRRANEIGNRPLTLREGPPEGKLE
jgi:polyphosphate kinase